jgi:hypothetical protein
MIVLTGIIYGSNLPVMANATKSSPQLVAVPQLSSSTPQFPDRIVASKTVVGYFSNFLWGDYFYAIVKTDRGQINFLIDRDEDCFLTHHQKSRLLIQYDLVNRYLSQAGGYYPIHIIRKIKTDRSDLSRWRKSISPAKLRQCRQIVEQASVAH